MAQQENTLDRTQVTFNFTTSKLLGDKEGKKMGNKGRRKSEERKNKEETKRNNKRERKNKRSQKGRNTVLTLESDTHHDMSPELVTIWLSSRKRQQDK
jgi:hypothetical protein